MITRVKENSRRLAAEWDKFWFAPLDLFGLSIFRILVCGGAFFLHLFRQFDYPFLFSENGILPFARSLQLMPSEFASPIDWGWFASNPAIGFALHVFLLGLLAGMAVGWIGRWGTWLAFLLNLVFLNRNFLCAYGVDQILSVWLLYLSFTQANRHLVLFRKKTRPTLTDDLGSSVGFRLIQLQLCIVYGFSGIEKARGNSWWHGDAIWNSLANGQLVSWDFGFLRFFPAALTLMTFGVLLWEIYFPVLVWLKVSRKLVLTIGFFMHLGIGLIMHLPFFGLFMVAPYFLFLEGRDLRKSLARFQA